MASVLATSRGFSCCNKSELICQENLGFSGSISIQKFPNSTSATCAQTQNQRLQQVQMRQSEPQPKLGVNGRAVKMVPTSDVARNRAPSERPKKVNGYANANGASLVKVNPASRTRKASAEELPPLPGLKILPSDEGFGWANENYNSVQRSIDVWSFVLSLRVRVLFDNAKWAYLGGFDEEKQVSFHCSS